MDVSAEPAAIASGNAGPVMMSTRTVVLDAATFCIRSVASIVLVVSRASRIALQTLLVAEVSSD